MLGESGLSIAISLKEHNEYVKKSLKRCGTKTSVLPPNGEKKPPSQQLSGKWLEDLGFNTGQPVIVTVERGKLVIETELRF
ncbi:Domain of unknown function DUF1813 HSP20-like protein [Pectobacterium parmentieri WPP163]|nr:SymE family type I addiction module toxin [Pectobacterium parmentieri]ACX86279.1 Domain of unknown function DUF1813 HSP20-like protein [Pectobacterium parmentieri WPP163]AYH04343.1 type I toxin-antitoxin system SymE family toxin [Pectobacterium parmentieri]AYH13165.1 type I toxin-antitoxin system SymE family toxin [Pectobacterium parmentieri]AYH21867.1 type I toxin-antitoxin system SymE family toxin [Pectobacterium parmentieri]MBI0552097.1 type I toxin-antitoxin system SymE family toxin [Pe